MIMVFIGFVLWPIGDVFADPSLWYECMLQCGLVWIVSAAYFLQVNVAAWFALPEFLSLQTFISIYLSGCIGTIIFWSMLTLVWTTGLNQPYPVPLMGAINATAALLFQVLFVWMKFPSSWRCHPDFRKHRKWLLFGMLYIVFVSVQYWALSWAFFAIPIDYQWILAIVLPLIREFGTSDGSSAMLGRQVE